MQIKAKFIVAFEERLRELGWVIGKNLSIDFEAGESSAQPLAIATRMVQQRAGVSWLWDPSWR